MLRVVQTENGTVRGLPAADPRITSFKGIPFAAEPVGENRWRAPQPAADWEGVRLAHEFSPIPMQVRQPLDDNNIYTREWAVEPDIAMDEDCLYLNVWTPARSADEKLPVFVWYFGGGLQVGHTAEMEFDGERIARRGIVVVTVGYRLNVFGFLCHPDITAEAPEAPANFGHLDQQAATRWVKRNIAAFGGDPDNLTVGGQSAGGLSVMNQLASPQNAGLFQRAIVQSGVFAQPYPSSGAPRFLRSLEEAEREGAAFFAFLGAATLAEARKLDAVYVRDKMLEFRGFWATVIDRQFCAGDAFGRFLRNKRWPVPVMFGHTSSEFIGIPEASSPEAFAALAAELFGDDAGAYLALCGYPSADQEETVRKASASALEYAIRVVGQANADTGARLPLYYYQFDADIPGWDRPGAFHSVDLWFFFETLAKCWRPFVGKHYDLARQMCQYWANFIQSGNPNGPDASGTDLPRWETYSPEHPNAMRFADQAELVSARPDELMKFLVRQYFKNNPLHAERS